MSLFWNIFWTLRTKGGLVMMVSSKFFFCDSFRFLSGAIDHRQTLLVLFKVASRTASSLSSVRRRSRMVEWDGGFDTLIRRPRTREWGPTHSDLFFFAGKKRVVFCFKRLVQVHLLKIWAFFLGGRRIWDGLGWIMLNLSSFSVGENLVCGTNLIFGGSPREQF